MTRLNLFKFKRLLKESLHSPKRQVSAQIFEEDFTDILLLMEQEPDLSLSEILRTALHYGLLYEPDISNEIRKIKERIEDKKQKEIERKNKLNFDIDRG